MLKQCLVAAVCFYSCSYSYCETVTSRTSNAAANAYTWAMQDILPQQTGLVVTGVNYRYSVAKATQDSLVVNVQNLNTSGNGYVFRSSDSWTGLPGNTLVKTVPVNNIGLQLWGRGEIKASGMGTLQDVYVSYLYKYDTCSAIPITDSACPGYVPPRTELKLPEITQDSIPATTLLTVLQLQQLDEQTAREKRFVEQAAIEKQSLNVVSRGSNRLLTAQVLQQIKQLESLDTITSFPQYNLAMPGGVYPDAPKYRDKVLPDSRNARRLNTSQQQLHNRLVDLQYNN